MTLEERASLPYDAMVAHMPSDIGAEGKTDFGKMVALLDEFGIGYKISNFYDTTVISIDGRGHYGRYGIAVEFVNDKFYGLGTYV